MTTDTGESGGLVPVKHIEIPESSTGDKAHALARAAIGSVPLFGAAGAELFGYIVQAPIEKRRNEWMTQVGNTLAELQNREQIDVEKLRDDPEFTDTVLLATQAALKTHSETKKAILRNAIANSALPNPPEIDVRTFYLRIVDELSPSQILILAVCDDPFKAVAGKAALREFSRRQVSLSYSDVIEAALPELKGKRASWHAFAQHLTNEGLLNSLFSPGTVPFYDAFLPQTSDLGEGLLRFIRDPDDSASADVSLSEEVLASFEKLRSELESRARTGKFEVHRVRMMRISGSAERRLVGFVVRFPREAARSPVLNGNPPDLVELRLSLVTDSVVEVFAFGVSPESVGQFTPDIQIGVEYKVDGNYYSDPGQAAERLIAIAESVFPRHEYWVHR